MVSGMGSIEIADMLRDRRLALSLKQAEVAARMGVCANSLSRWERHQHGPTLFMLTCWANALGVEVELNPNGHPG